MSAFQVSDAHVSAILQAVYGYTFGGHNIWQFQNDETSHHYVLGALDSWKAEANVLMAENIRSVNWRYRSSEHVPHEVDTGSVQLDLKAPRLSAVAVLKLIDCLEYQSCESDDYYTTEAYKLLCKYRSKLACQLPGYNDEKWEI